MDGVVGSSVVHPRQSYCSVIWISDRVSARLLTVGKILGTLHMRTHTLVFFATAKFLGKSFVFKGNVTKEGLPRDNPSGLGAGGLEFKSRRPDH